MSDDECFAPRWGEISYGGMRHVSAKEMREQDRMGRIASALESIADSLTKLANPLVIVPADPPSPEMDIGQSP